MEKLRPFELHLYSVQEGITTKGAGMGYFRPCLCMYCTAKHTQLAKNNPFRPLLSLPTHLLRTLTYMRAKPQKRVD